ncbi:MAG: adenylate/guanylate cyclase domain-containing protein [Acidimicrobiales bacterium]
MAQVTDTRYARTTDGLYIAYQVAGEGPPDLVATAGGFSHLEVYSEYEPFVRWGERIASFGRFVVFDKRGTGMSDPVPPGRAPALEERMDDLRAVMDAVGLERAALLGFFEGNAMAALYAATHPNHVSALILYGPWMRFMWAPDYPWAFSRDLLEHLGEAIEAGTDADFLAPMLAPSAAEDPEFRLWWAKLHRNAGTPGQRGALYRMNFDIDVRAVLGSIRVPTLILHRRNDPLVPVEAGRWAASQIPGAKFVTLDGEDHLPFVGEFEDFAGEIEEFLTGHRREIGSERVLATVMFVDIVDSTRQAAALGDHQWKQVLDDYERIVERQLERYRGRLVKTLGDGSLSTFDGPARAIRCAAAIREAVGALGLRTRSGLHTGEVEVRGEDVSGLAVHLAHRVSSAAAPAEVLVSSTVKDLVVGSGIEFDDRGERQLKGIPRSWRLFAVAG